MVGVFGTGTRVFGFRVGVCVCEIVRDIVDVGVGVLLLVLVL